MSYIGNQPTSVAFLTDQFSGTGSQTAFTLSAAPANTASILVAVSGVLQDPSTYATTGTTLTFSAAPPSGSGNISVRYLGIPASGVTTTAYRTVTEFTATAGQTTFTPPSYTVGYINVYRNGVRLAAADYTATNGTTVVLASGATAGDTVTVESYYVSSVIGAIPATAGAVTDTYLNTGAVTQTKLGTNVVGNGPAFVAYMSAATPIADATWTKLRFNTELYDTNSNFDTTNYRFTPTVAGFYQVNFNWRNSAPMTATFAISRLYKNGSVALTAGWQSASSNYASPVMSNIIYLNGSTDYIEAYAYQNSGSAIDTDYDTLYAFTGALVRAA